MNAMTYSDAGPRGQVVGTGLVALDRIHVGTQHPLFEELGGSCGNVLISLAMLGRPVIPLLRLGTDTIGERLESDLRRAGANTAYVARRGDVRSPVIAEMLDPQSRQHSFSFVCPQSSERFGLYEPITRCELEPAWTAISACTIFYADRVSETICEAMEAAAACGAIVHFEPSAVSDEHLFKRALASATIFKYSLDRLSAAAADWLRPEAYGIVTAGGSGLEVHHAGAVHYCAAWDVDDVQDTCGAGDMVTLGLLDAILQSGLEKRSSLSIGTILSGVKAGQRLAAANCAYVGARGLFRERGAAHARALLADS